MSSAESSNPNKPRTISERNNARRHRSGTRKINRSTLVIAGAALVVFIGLVIIIMTMDDTTGKPARAGTGTEQPKGD